MVRHQETHDMVFSERATGHTNADDDVFNSLETVRIL